MKFKCTPIKKMSDRGRLMKQCDSIHFQILKLRRGETCELSGLPANGLGRFHILSVATHPRLRYVDENVLLCNWMPFHFGWHHWGPNDKRNKSIIDKITALRGPDYEQKLLERERFVGKMDSLYLGCLLETFKKELHSLTNLKGL